MANNNPSPATRFSADRPGRAKQKGARDRLSAALLTALADDFEAHGIEALRKVRETDPATYLRVCANLLPREMEPALSLENLSDEKLTLLLDLLERAKAEEIAPSNP